MVANSHRILDCQRKGKKKNVDFSNGKFGIYLIFTTGKLELITMLILQQLKTKTTTQTITKKLLESGKHTQSIMIIRTANGMRKMDENEQHTGRFIMQTVYN